MRLKVTVNGIKYDIDVEVEENEVRAPGPILIGGAAGGAQSAPVTASLKGASANAVVAPLSGTVTKIFVEEGQEIKDGEVLCVLEAMKMETEITAPHDGKVGRILVQIGDAVSGGEGLIEVD